MTTLILRAPAVTKMRGRGHSTHYRDIKEGLFTRPVPIGRRAVGWPAYEVRILNQARVAGLADNDIRKLVIGLETARCAGMADQGASDLVAKLEKAGDTTNGDWHTLFALLASCSSDKELPGEPVPEPAKEEKRKPAAPKTDWLTPLRGTKRP